MLRFALAAAGLSATFAAVQASVSVSISNSCSESVALYDNSATTTLASGSSTTRTLANGYVGMFRNGVSDEATLAEISVDSDGTPWYDISIIPPDPGTCSSLSACQAQTGKTGFNTAMQITPQDNAGEGTCNVLTCEADGCADAYQYPSDDTKTHTCPSGTSFEVTFCPGGSGGTSTSSSTPTTTTATPTPTTATPTPTTATPTAAPTPTPTEAPVSSSSASGSAGIQVQSKTYSGNFTLTSSSGSASTGSAGISSNAGVQTAGDATSNQKTSTHDSTTQTTGKTTKSSSDSDGAVEVTTQSSDNSSSSVTILIAVGGCVAALASAGFIYGVRQKKKQLDLEAKSPMTAVDRSCRDISVLVSTPDSLSARL
ncbi:hypothetical protein PHYBOEH_011903 [Phytophthora boehmeriae]|uniref:Carbohydrate-binding protein n=1 Tax=Phytophthora boehmeriae TaxID=109152 RepID=A0A8T1WYL8_9STRA|nr:hypothetical protein PHYBOEH_011903 [Phytophthora boehmeriae]